VDITNSYYHFFISSFLFAWFYYSNFPTGNVISDVKDMLSYLVFLTTIQSKNKETAKEAKTFDQNLRSNTLNDPDTFPW
jgi:hypothetical protein